jgi:hypothetical protein
MTILNDKPGLKPELRKIASLPGGRTAFQGRERDRSFSIWALALGSFALSLKIALSPHGINPLTSKTKARG